MSVRAVFCVLVVNSTSVIQETHHGGGGGGGILCENISCETSDNKIEEDE